MNITIITSQLPYPLVSGGAQAQFNIVDTLRKEHHFTIIFPENKKNSRQALVQLQALWPEVEFHVYSYARQLCYPKFLYDKIVRACKLKFASHSERFQVERILKPYGYYCSNDFIGYVNNIINNYKADIVQIDFYPHLHLVNYLQTTARKIFIQHEIRYIRNQRILTPYRLTDKELSLAKEVKCQEIADLNLFDTVVTLTETDKQQLISDGVTTPIEVSPAAVSTPVRPFEQWNGKLTFIGGFTHIPNQEGMEWFLKEVLPLVNTDQITAFEVTGKGWPQSYKAIHPKLHFLGFVKDLYQVVHNSILIVPLLTGSGMRMKILDAAAIGAPFVTTSVGVEGLLFRPDESCLVGNSPMEFAQAINRLVADENLKKTLADNAQDIFKNYYSIEALSKIRNAIYNNMLEQF